ncbi:hypothetical protein P12x_005344 [Tundrisphaera lichenicola]|uniref:hypothetical protein n=1 Tax=Tundrisphaera lichenicola TaxID=2029860 RepID=UPI003EB96AD8
MPSDQERLRQVQSRIGQIKATEYPVVVGGDKGYKIVERPWKDMPEPSKLAILQDSVDWSGVTNRDRAHLLLCEIDPGKLTDPQRNRLIEAAAREDPVAGEKPLSAAHMKALGAEVRADEHAARARDFGEADAATYHERLAEAYRLRGEEHGPEQPPSSPLTEAVLQEVERGWSLETELRDHPIRPLTKELIECCQLDVWPGVATVVDFGIDSSSHLGALQFAIRQGLVTPQELDSAMGSGAKLTEIAQRGENPYRDVTFSTSWDLILPEPEEPPVQEKPGGKEAFFDILPAARSSPPDTRSDFKRMLEEAGKSSQPRERDRGGPER